MLALVALALTACESNQERSAKLEKAAAVHKGQAARQRALAQRALIITRRSAKVKVTATAAVKGAEGAAAIVTLHNISGTSLRDVPIQITVSNARGAPVYKNNIPGLSTTLVSVALVPAHGTLTWIDDQVQATGVPASVSAEVGEGTPSAGAIPQLSVQSLHLSEQQLEGNLVNHSAVTQQELVIDALARRSGTVVAAGRAVIAEAAAGASTPFQIFFVGNPSGAKLGVTVVATSPG